MRILTAGGGSGGHVTPVVAVLRELKKSSPDVELRFWCDKGFEKQSRSIMAEFDRNLIVETIISGKLRRYHKIPLWQQLIRLRTIVWPNLRDGFKVIAGTIQSVIKLIKWRPDIIFAKGGFVCIPVGIAARMLNIPLIIHDSDAHPGLTNRILSRWADRILTGAPLHHYSYPEAKTTYVGIPINVELDSPGLDQAQRKHQLGFDASRPLVFCTGGGLGAARINQFIADNVDVILQSASLAVVTGQNNYQETKNMIKGDYPSEKLQIFPFISGLAEYFAAADIVVTRAGMTTMFELAALGKPTIIIPNAHLTGGHQTKNAAVYSTVEAAVVLEEEVLSGRPELLAQTIDQLITDTTKLEQLSRNITSLAKPDAAKQTASIIISTINKN